MHPAQHDHTLVPASTTGPGWLWVLVLAGVVTVTAATLLRTVLPGGGRGVQPALAAAAFALGLLVLVLTPATVLPLPLVGAAVLLTAAAVGCHLARARRPTGPLRLLAPPLALAAVAGTVAVPAAAWATGTTDLGPAVSSALFTGVVGLVWLALWEPRSRMPALLAHAAGWVLAPVVLGATTAVALAALPA